MLQHVGYGLFGLFLAFLLKLVWPVALLQPAWQLQFANGLRTTGLFPLLGAVLLLLAGRLHGPSGGGAGGSAALGAPGRFSGGPRLPLAHPPTDP